VTSAPTTPSRPHVDTLDGLRALAIALVVWLHTWQLSWMSNHAQIAGVSLDWGMIPETGFLGVELFFFISGFCLFYPYARHLWEGKPLPALGTYVYRRAIKILPSYWLAIALLIFVVPPAFGTLQAWLWQLGTHALFIHNWFIDTKDSINGVFWSLAVEVQFYVLFPAICWAFRRLPLGTYFALCVIALAWRFGVTETFPASDSSYWLNQLPGYIDFFANGMLAAYALVMWRAKPGPAPSPWLLTLVAMSGFGALGWLMKDVYDVRYHMDFWPVGWQVAHRTYLGMAFFVIACASVGAVRPWRKLFSNAALAFVSTVSYNLYIWHQVIARLLYNHHIPAPTTADPHADPTWQWQFMVLSMSVSLLFAAIVTYGFERPLLRHGVRGVFGPLWRQRDARVE
jgi:peptidoglycan/LPS O-acetylase OafA/YrhL